MSRVQREKLVFSMRVAVFTGIGVVVALWIVILVRVAWRFM